MEKKYQNPKFFDQKDTEELVATYTYGRGLTPLTTTPRRPEVMNQQMNQQRMNQNAPIGGGPMGNMPGTPFSTVIGSPGKLIQKIFRNFRKARPIFSKARPISQKLPIRVPEIPYTQFGSLF